MKEEMRAIQTLVYVADDGTVFHSEYDCKEHEARTKRSCLDGKIFDDAFNPVKDIDECFYFYPSTIQDIINFIEVSNFFGTVTEGITTTSPISIYEFNSADYQFENMQEKIKKIEEAKKKFEQTKKE